MTREDADEVAMKYGTTRDIAERARSRAHSASVYLSNVADGEKVSHHTLRAAIGHLEQAERARLAEKYGYHVDVCRSAEEAIALLERWFKGEEV